MVYRPDMAAEVTMQPVRRYGMDAAILFSDILVVPDALGQEVRFVEGRGPVLEAVRCVEDLVKFDLEATAEKFGSVCETVSKVRGMLAEEEFDGTALIGFCGSPWTVACYMVEGGSSRDFASVKRWALCDPEGFAKLIGIVTEASIVYLRAQIDAGAEAVQLFDSWAGVLDAEQFRRWVTGPTAEIVLALRESHPGIPVIGFPRGSGVLYRFYVEETGVDAAGIDYTMPTKWVKENLQALKPVQGNLDPLRLLEGGVVMEEEIERILRDLAGGSFVFNLGHGVIKETPPEHVARLAEIVKGWQG